MKDFFISYSWADADIVRPIAEQLLTDVPSLWFDHREMNAGDYIPKEIRTALQNSHTVILMWSKHSHVSRWSRDERNAAILLGKRIIPCLLDDTPLPKRFQADDIIYLDFQKSNDQEKVNLLLDAIQHRFDPKSIQRPEVEKIPFRRNPNFIGRDEPLKLIESHLSNDSTVAIAGLGGVGKTELIVEYLFQHASEYNHIFWLRAEGAVTLAISFANIAHSLNLPAKDEKDQEVVIQAVIRWLEHNDGWLLVFDNAQELNKIRRYLPNHVSGHILITSRNDAWGGVASVINLEEWPREESIQFLLKRLGQDDTQGADGVADELGDLPLALEQAGAYIEAKNVSLANYKKRFLKERKALLERGELSTEYPDNISTTWEMAFREVKRESVTSLAFMKLCAFLAPEPIPIDELLEGAPHAPDGLADAFSGRVAFEDMYGPLLRYSLIRVENDQITIHRLVQAVTQDRMTQEEQQKTAESVVRLVAHIFPSTGNLNASLWPQCQRWLSHAYAVTSHAEYHQVGWQKVSILYSLMGHYLHGQADYSDTEPLYRKALVIDESSYGGENPNVASSLNDLASLLQDQGKYTEAEPLIRRALDIDKSSYGGEHPNVANSLNGLARLLQSQGKYSEAEPLFRRALAIRKASLGEKHPEVAISLNNLAVLLNKQGKYAEAEPLHRRALEIREASLGEDHPNVAASLYNLASLLQDQGKYDEAEPLIRRALDIYEASLGWKHPNVATSLDNLAGLLYAQGKYSEAELLYKRALDISEASLGIDHPHVATSLNNLASLLRAQGKYSVAEPFIRRALDIREANDGKEHPNVASSLNELAGLLIDQNKYAEAEPLYRRALEIREVSLGDEHPDVATSLNNLASLLLAQGRYSEAEPLIRQALDIREVNVGEGHPYVASNLNTLASLLNDQGNYSEAEPLYRRALDIYEASLGRDHPNVAKILNNLAMLLKAQGNYSEAETLYIRALDIYEASLGGDHPHVASILKNLASLLQDQGKYAEAEPLYREALDIREANDGEEHPNVASSLNELAGLLIDQNKYAEAEPLIRRALEIFKAIFGNEHPHTINVKKNLDGILLRMKSSPKK